MTVRHGAVCAGLALALTFGAAAPVFADDLSTQAPQQEGADTTTSADEGSSTGDGTDSAATVGTVDDAAAAPDAAAAIAAVPTDVDRAATSQDSVAGALARSAAPAAAARTRLQPVSDEMKYFTINESGQNYDQGFGAGDGYNALGYYQFDRRWSLVSFLNFCVSYDAQTFSMFQPVLAVAGELSSSAVSMYDVATGQLTDVGRLADSAWHAAYAANPTLFAALQDEFAISNYYRPTESWLKSALGIDITGRADCVKGLVWSLTNLFGTGGVQKYLIAANLSNDMTDREFVNATVDSFPGSLSAYLPDTPYYTSYVNRYERERQTCLSYIAADEAAVQQPAGDQSAADEPSADQSETDQSSPDQPTQDQPGAGGSASSQPDSNGEAAEQPGSNSSGSDQAGSDKAGSNEPGSDQSSSDGASNAVTSQPSTSAPNKAPARPQQTPQGDAASDGDGASDVDGAAGGPADGAAGSDNGASGDANSQAQSGTGSASDGDAGNGADDDTDSSTGAGTESDADGKGAGASDGSATEGESAKSTSEDDGAKDGGAKSGSAKTGSDSDAGKTGSDTGTKTTGTKRAAATDDNANGNGGAGVIPMANMPKTGDLVMLSILASGSLAAFGATAVYAGRTAGNQSTGDSAAESTSSEDGDSE